MLNLLTGKEKYNSINTEVFYECIETILKKENLRGQVPYSDIPKLIRVLSSRKENITSVKDLINEYKNTPIIRPGDIKNLIKFNPNLIEKRKQDIIDICTWLLPLFRKKEIEPFSINILVAMNSGQGKTLFAECLSEALSKILSLHKGVQRKIGFITMNPDIETTAIDLSNYPSGSIIIIDDMMKTNVANRNANVNFVFVADKKSATSVTSVLKNEIYYTINIEDMNSQDIMEMISNRHTIEDDNVKRDMLFVIEKLIESKVSPKAILNIIELGVEHEKQAQSKRDFLFNPNTIAHLAHKAGVKIGYDFNIEKLREKLLSSVFGQEDAIEMVATSVGMAKYGIRNKNKPVLTALLVGPTGVGKTELSIALSNIMFGTDSIIRLDMGEYTEHHSVSRLIGCFTPETLILMSDGKMKPISEVQIGDSVITHLGNIKKVIDKYKYDNNTNIDSYRIANSNIRLNCTKQHEILAIKPKIYNKRIDKDSYNFKEAKFYNSKDLKVGDIVLYPKNIEVSKYAQEIDLTQFIINCPKYKFDNTHVWAYENYKINRFIKIDKDFTRLIGYFLSEGGCSKTKKTTKFSFNINELEYIDEVQELLYKVFGNDIQPKILKVPERNTTHIIITSRIINIFLSELFGRTQYDRKLPHYFNDLNKDLILNLLETALFGDGSKTLNTKIAYKTVSLDLASQLNTLFRKIGYSTQFNKIAANNKSNRNNSTIYIITITGKLNIEKLNNEFPKLKIHQPLTRNNNIQRHQYQDDDYYYYHITEKEEILYNGPVYDLSIEGDSSYIANNISVHNSPPGYVGYSTDTAFSAALKKNSRRVILFDEIEKAAPEVHQLLLSLLDTGTITLGNGESIDAKDSIIIMTSNALVDKIKKVDIGFNEEKGKSKILSNYRKALEENKIFSPEFLNRIDAVIPFNFLSDEVCTKIVKREIEKMKSSLDMQGYKISIPEEVIQLILNSTQKPFNGRSIVRSVDAIKRLVVMKIIKDKDNNNIVVTAEDVRANPY